MVNVSPLANDASDASEEYSLYSVSVLSVPKSYYSCYARLRDISKLQSFLKTIN